MFGAGFGVGFWYRTHIFTDRWAYAIELRQNYMGRNELLIGRHDVDACKRQACSIFKLSPSILKSADLQSSLVTGWWAFFRL